MERKFDNAKLKRFAQYARRSLIEQVSAKLKLVLAEESAARRENAPAVRKLEENIKERTEKQVLERVAYIWFNRFCALRFMDVNRYNRINIVSPLPGQFQPEILAEAKMGHIDDEIVADDIRAKVNALLTGKFPSRDPQGEAYRLLVVAACNYWHRAMPFLFERIEDYTELLMPDDLLSGNSILAYTRETMTPDVCKDVEVIGWLYQFYISEKKDEVFDILRRGKKIERENIPAATQLFTPDWIVKYLVENSLGRLWMLNHPKSGLAEAMKYYIKPEQAETDFLRIGKPEDIKICDPACGSGHMLVYAFDLLVKIYKEVYGDVSDIPERILTHNLYGIEIDERAGELAAFALTMKALQYDKRFIRRSSTRSELVQPNICVLEKIELTLEQTDSPDWKKIVDQLSNTGVDASILVHDLHLFAEADNFGSLLKPKMTAHEVSNALAALDVYDQAVHAPSFAHQKIVSKCRRALQQATFLISQYHTVVANPPYMGIGGMNSRLASWAKENYPDSKSDLFAMFMERGLELSSPMAFVALVTMQSWMFLGSYEKLREKFLSSHGLRCLLHMDNLVMGIAFGTSASVWQRQGGTKQPGNFTFVGRADLTNEGVPFEFPVTKNRSNQLRNTDFFNIPSSPIAYWIGNHTRAAFAKFAPFGEFAETRLGMATADNNKFLRRWSEVSKDGISFNSYSREEALISARRWFPYAKGGEFRKWYGNNEFVIDWAKDGEKIRSFTDANGKIRSHNYNLDYIFQPGITWNALSSSDTSMRLLDCSIFDNAGSSCFPPIASREGTLGLLNSKLLRHFIELISPTFNYQPGDIARVPFHAEAVATPEVREISSECIALARADWDNFETSWDFRDQPLLRSGLKGATLEASWHKWENQSTAAIRRMKDLETANNQIFIAAYGLDCELQRDVSEAQITLSRADTCRDMAALLSYATGCMFGRYALEKPGLILANQGETLEDYLRLIPEPTFPADKDNVIPMLDGDWFTDDISERFLKFLRVTFGEEHFEENLKFIEKALGKEIRKYFLKDFYNDHVKRYKKRPIYWLFSSPRGSFNALIYMHRYRPDTVSVVLNEYLREFRNKLTSHVEQLRYLEASADSSKSAKAKAIKEIDNFRKIIEELNDYEREILYPLATEQKEIDLDDGVKVNYTKFGAALKKISGLEATEE